MIPRKRRRVSSVSDAPMGPPVPVNVPVAPVAVTPEIKYSFPISPNVRKRPSPDGLFLCQRIAVSEIIRLLPQFSVQFSLIFQPCTHRFTMVQ